MKNYFMSAEIRPSSGEIAYSSGITEAEDHVNTKDVFNAILHDLADHYDVEPNKVTLVAFYAV